MSKHHTAFMDLYNRISVEAQFNNAYHNGTGYFNALVNEPFKEPVRMESEDGRKIVIIPLTNGENFVVFERYTANKAIAWNGPFRRADDKAFQFHKEVLDGHAMRINDELPLNTVLSGIERIFNVTV